MVEGHSHQYSPGENIKFRNATLHQPETVQKAIEEIVSHVEESFRERAKKSIEGDKLDQYFGPEIYSNIAETINFAIEYFENLGIEDIKFGKLFVFHKVHNELYGEGGLSAGTTVTEPNIVGGEDIKRLVFLKTFAHELYHSTAIISHTIPNSGGELVQDNLGASYTNKKTEDEGSLFEEGLACTFEDMMFEKISGMFEEGAVSEYYRLMSIAYKHSPNLSEETNDDMHRVNIKELDYDELKFYWQPNPYAYATDVVRLLLEVIPDFEVLVERARIYRETISLAKAIEKYFGQGSYRLVTAATPADGKNVLAELNKRYHDGD